MSATYMTLYSLEDNLVKGVETRPVTVSACDDCRLRHLKGCVVQKFSCVYARVSTIYVPVTQSGVM